MQRSSKRCVLGLALAVGALGSTAMAADAPRPTAILTGRPTDQGASGGLLGGMFESRAAGISFRTPANSLEVRKPGVPDVIVEYVNEKEQMVLQASVLELKVDRKVMDWKNEKGTSQKGLMTETVETFQERNPTSELLKKELRKVNGRDVGFVAFRFSQGTVRKLLQEALIPLTDRSYYVLSMQSPATKSAEAADVDAKEKLAVDTFAEILDSVKLMDRSAVVKEQDQNLKNSQAILETLRLPKTMEQAIVPEQWMRLVRDGKDIGYTYIVEEKAKEDGREGILISVKSRTIPEAEQVAEVSSRMFVSKEWKHESWSHVWNTTVKGKQDEGAELGLSDQEFHYEVERQPDLLSASEVDAKKQPDIKELLRYKLEIRTKLLPKPKEYLLPAWYLPQAARHLLPRMLPLDKKRGYMFVAYVSELRQAMLRYVEVGDPKEVEFDGKKIKVIPIEDRVGFEGVPTTYFVTPEGKYMGSETVYKVAGKDSVIRVLPTDEATLAKLWKNSAKLQKPSAADVPNIPVQKK